MSDPLDHLLSVDLGESSPLSDVFEDESKTQVLLISKKPFKKVRFADTCLHSEGDIVLKKLLSVNKSEESACKSNTKEVKGILKVIPTSNFEILKGWSKPSPSVPVTVNIVSSTENRNHTKSDICDGSSAGNKNDGSIPALATMDDGGMPNEDKILCMGDDLKDDEHAECQLNSLIHVEDNKHESVHHEGSERCLLKRGSNVELRLGELESSQINSDVLDEELNGDTQTLHDENIKHNFDSDEYLLVDEIRKISKELFVKTACHLEDVKCGDHDGSIESDILPDANFLSPDIVNDILDTQHGGEKLLVQVTDNPEVTTETGDNSERKLVSGDAVLNVGSPAVKLGVHSRVKRPSSPHTSKLKRVLEETVPEKPTAKDLRTIAFSAWCAIKADEKKSLVKKLKNAEKQVQESVMKEKSLKEASAVKAFMCWKEQKEKVIKFKKENEMKVAETKVSKTQEEKKKKKEEADLVFKAWKKQKDEELKEQLRKQKLKTKKEAMNKGQSEEIKKLDAAAAFNAWKFQKSIKLQRKEKEHLVKKELETSLKAKETSERDEEAIKAYELWLEYKEQFEDRYDWRNRSKSKPPWSPPGRIA